MSRALDRCYNIADLRRAASKRLPDGIFQYIDGGTEDGVALAENRAAFERIKLVPRFMVDLSERDMGTTLFGARSELPFGIGPTAVAGLLWHRGEYALAKAAAAAGIPFTLATGSLTSMETIAQAGGRLWFQLYMWEEKELSYDLVRRARDLGFETLVVTVDSALGRLREHNERNGFTFPFKPNLRALTDMTLHPRWLTTVLFRTILDSGMPKNANYPPHYQPMVTMRGTPKPKSNKAMTWDDVARLREMWPGPFVVKSILNPTDARRAVERGADGIVISNHGGRGMDSSVATIDALPGIAAEVGGETTIMLDSGVRRGSDIVKALGLGADFVLLGRATLYGIATAGEEGASKAIRILATEFEKTMGTLGRRTVAEIDRTVFPD
jgi:(S)-mandelate dehydrogenase